MPVAPPLPVPTAPPALRAVPVGRTERALGSLVGLDRGVDPLPGDGTTTPPAAAFREVVRQALQRSPCLVSFSGGRDSSTVLAAAASVAREEGLPLPVPVTLVFPGIEQADETQWQDRVLGHLGIDDRVHHVVDEELDVLGPVARRVLLRHGPVMPFNLYCHEPLLELAAGGSLLTGIGGDELALASTSLHVERVVARGVRGPAERARVAVRRGPTALRYPHHLRTARSTLAYAPWLTARGRWAVRHEVARTTAAERLGFPGALRDSLWRSRGLRDGTANLDRMAAVHDVVVRHPFFSSPVLRALAGAAPWEGLGGRARVLRTLVGDLLPEDVLTRSSKASFGDALWRGESAAFAAAWDGELDPALVDARRVREQWLDPAHDALSAALLQRAWLAGRAAPGG